MIKLLTISQKFGVDFFMSSDTSTLSHTKTANHFTKFGVDVFMSSDTSTLSHDKTANHFTKVWGRFLYVE